jgi:hypothetical protein
MLRSKILLARLALIPALILVTGHSSLGEAKSDDCRAKPDASAPAGLHWYYRVDRANSRHCWYLHEQGMRVHSLVHTTSRDADAGNDTAPESDTAVGQVWKLVPVTSGRPVESEQALTAAEQQRMAFATRWVDLPKSVDLNAHGPVLASNGYAAEPGAENRQEQLQPAWANVSAATDDVRQGAGTPTSFGSISLAGAVILALLLMSEALIRFARTFGATWGLRLRTDSHRGAEPSEPDTDETEPDAAWRMAPTLETMSRTQTGAGELRRLLQRAGTGLRPPQSFAPSRSPLRPEDPNRARAQSALARLKSRSFSGMTWAPL